MEDMTCIDCDALKKKSDGLAFENEVLRADYLKLDVIHEAKLDEYKKLILLNAKLRLLLSENGVGHEF